MELNVELVRQFTVPAIELHKEWSDSGDARAGSAAGRHRPPEREPPGGQREEVDVHWRALSADADAPSCSGPGHADQRRSWQGGQACTEAARSLLAAGSFLHAGDSCARHFKYARTAVLSSTGIRRSTMRKK